MHGSQPWFYFTEAGSSATYEVSEDTGVDPKGLNANDLDGKTGTMVLIPVRWPEPGETEIGVLLQHIKESDGKILGTFPIRVRVKALFGGKHDARNIATGRRTEKNQQWRVW